MAKEKIVKASDYDIQNMSIEQLREFLCYRFHEIRHTESFGTLIDRLEKSEEKVERLMEDSRVEDTKADFRERLEDLINCYNIENGSDTPDFILAEYLVSCLEAFDKAVKKRAELSKVR